MCQLPWLEGSVMCRRGFGVGTDKNTLKKIKIKIKIRQYISNADNGIDFFTWTKQVKHACAR